MIAGKTHSEILSMNHYTRFQWYKTIIPEQKTEAMDLVEVERRRKLSEAGKDKHPTEETRRKMSESMSGHVFSKERNQKVSEALKNKPKSEEHRRKMAESTRERIRTQGHPMKDKKHSVESRAKMSKFRTGLKLSMETRKKMSESAIGRKKSREHRGNIAKANIGKVYSEERKRKHSESSKEYWNTHDNPMQGEKHPGEVRQRMSEHAKERFRIPENNTQWKGGSSFDPYCPKFNGRLKEQIRNRDNRNCVLCGKSEILNGERLSVHHIDGDKMQGCDGKGWYLCSICRSCNSRKDTTEKEFLIVANSAS